MRSCLLSSSAAAARTLLAGILHQKGLATHELSQLGCRTYEAVVLQARGCSCGSGRRAGPASSLPELVVQALQAAFDAAPSAFLNRSLEALTDTDRALRSIASNFLQAQFEEVNQTPQNGTSHLSGMADSAVIRKAALLSESVQAWALERKKSLPEGVRGACLPCKHAQLHRIGCWLC